MKKQGSLSALPLRIRIPGGADSVQAGVPTDEPLKGKRKRNTDKYIAALEELKDDLPSKAKKTKATTRRGKPKIKRGGGTGNNGSADEGDDKSRMKSLVNQISRLTRNLPKSIPEGAPNGKIAVSLDEEGESGWAVFNKFFDRTFGEDTRNSSGRLQHLTRGEHGMNFVNRYLVSVVDNYLEDPQFPVDLAVGKLMRLCDELRILAGAVNQEDDHGEEDSCEDEDDGDYFYHSRTRSPSLEVGDVMYNSNGEEIVDEDDAGPSSHRNVAPSESEEETMDRKVKTRAKADKGKENWVAFKSSSRKVRMSREDMDVSSEEESDGQSALRKIEEVERIQRGPKSNTRDFWTERLVTEKGKLRWEFKCKCCV
ncbi:hypothetical protein DFJ43DRAFT_1043695 [Lentinula guzmanii]|uniref:Uncharacterized protein n=1 Tax=Lentinula guzmanii TaxID=2804957 RepID=A0AA38J7H3_9AGAR|nr:hypothetical protein DFJ43DRAFT_1043695 [Lentinula guzmanii]